MSQENLAEIVNLNARQISRIESGANFVSPETLEMLSIAFDKEIYELFKFSSNKEEILCSQGEHVFHYDARKYKNYTKFQRAGIQDIFCIKNFLPEKKEEIFSKIAKTHNKAVVINYKEGVKTVIHIIYFTNGTFKVYNSEKLQLLDLNLSKLFNEITKLSENPPMLNFIWCAIEACKSKKGQKKIEKYARRYRSGGAY